MDGRKIVYVCKVDAGKVGTTDLLTYKLHLFFLPSLSSRTFIMKETAFKNALEKHFFH